LFSNLIFIRNWTLVFFLIGIIDHGKIGAGYLFDAEFQTAYFERGTDCYVDFLDEVPSASQIKKDASTMYGALISAYQGGIESRILIESRNKQDGIQA
jgi:hypothetical protein